MLRVTVAALVASLAWFSPAYAESWVSAGLEDGKHVAINLEGVPNERTAPFRATLALVPAAWPANGYAYELLIAEFDCTARSRTVRTRIEYSGRHDPRRNVVSTPVAVTAADSEAVAMQLGIVCSQERSATLPKYGWLDPLLRSLGLPHAPR